MSEYPSGLAPQLARGGEKISAKISRKTLGTSALGERGSRAKKPAQTPSRNDATQSSSIKEVLVGDAPAPIAIDIRTNDGRQ